MKVLHRWDGLLYVHYHRQKSVHYTLEKLRKLAGMGACLRISKMAQKAEAYLPDGDMVIHTIVDLSAVIFDHQGKSTPKYEKWARELFSDFRKPLLKHKVYFWCEAWDNSLEGPWTEYGPTSLSFLEYQLIGLGSKLIKIY